jgi:phenylacetate-CoA ligase
MNIWTLVKTRIEHLRNARRSRAEIEARQLDKFRRLVAHVNGNSPYYRDLIAEHRIDVANCVPADFPPLTKTELMANFDRIVTDRRITHDAITDFLAVSKEPNDLFAGDFTVVHTSGTSGEVGYFVYSAKDWTRGVAQGLRVNPPRKGKRRLAFLGAANGHFTGVSFAATSRRSLLKLKYDVDIYDINSPIRPVIEGLNKFQPDILMGYATAFAILAERQQKGELSISPKWVQSSGEPISAADRSLIESVFGVPVLNVYSCTEHLIMGLGKADYGGIYLFEDDLIFELEPDHTLITNLFNFTQPLIRYRMDDVLEKMEDPEPAYPFTKVREISGRKEQIPFFINRHGEEDFISPHIINEFIVKNVRRFQFQVVDKTSCIFRVCLDDGLSEEQRSHTLSRVEARLGEIFTEKEMDNVIRQVEPVDDLRPDPKTGKFRLILMPEHVS